MHLFYSKFHSHEKLKMLSKLGSPKALLVGVKMNEVIYLFIHLFIYIRYLGLEMNDVICSIFF